MIFLKKLKTSNIKKKLFQPNQEVVHEVVGALPLGTNVTSTFAPLTQFNSLIGESVEKIVADLVQND